MKLEAQDFVKLSKDMHVITSCDSCTHAWLLRGLHL